MGKTILLIAIVFTACHSPEKTDRETYPAMVEALNKRTQFDYAKMEMYKVMTCEKCDCLGLITTETKETEKVNVLSLDIRLDTINIENDTIYYFFDCFKAGTSDATSIGVGTIGLYECSPVFAIAYRGDSNVPLLALIGDTAFAPLDSVSTRKRVDENFKKCITQKDIEVNKWILKHLHLLSNEN